MSNPEHDLAPTTRGRIVMLVNNPCVTDSRVIKSAEALVAGGWHVAVVCRLQGAVPKFERRNGVEYHRVPMQPYVSQRLWTFLRTRLKRTKSQSLTAPARNNVNAFGNDTTAGLRALVPLARKTWRVLIFIERGLLVGARSVHWFNDSVAFSKASFKQSRALKPDVVHCHDLTTLHAGLEISRVCGAQLVYDSHELEMHRNARYSALAKRKRRGLETRGITASDAVITVSDSIADYLATDYKIARPHVVLNSPDFEEVRSSERCLRSDIGLAEQVPLAVYVGSITFNRGIENAVRALSHYPKLHLALVGPSRIETVNEAVALARSSGTSDRLHLVAPVRPHEVVSYIRSADVSVLPIQNVCLSYYFCMPNKLLESVFAGVPVAVANLLELKRFVSNHRCGVVMDETNPKSIADAIATLICNRENYVLDDLEKKKIADHYGWAAQAAKLRDIYAGLRQDSLINNR